MRTRFQNHGLLVAKEIRALKGFPLYLCPALFQVRNTHFLTRPRHLIPCPRATKRRQFNLSSTRNQSNGALSPHDRAFPVSCPGCGALAHSVDPDGAGFYSPGGRSVKRLFDQNAKRRKIEDDIFKAALRSADAGLLQELGAADSSPSTKDEDANFQTPFCDRCHNLIHHHSGVSIDHPSIESIADTIAETPHKHNHVYHVIDAADFPLSLIPNIHEHLSAAPQRSQNRRSKAGKYYHGRKTELSFIITRSDLLAPKKEQVDALMPYLLQVLRDALGPFGKDVRLGNVRCVSSKRGWWTKNIKEDIWHRGGGGWLVGKANVGKSNLFEMVFPKGKMGDIKYASLQNQSQKGHDSAAAKPGEYAREIFDQFGKRTSELSALPSDPPVEEDSLLPPAQPETPFPVMPVISSLPGTTASPIRLPFGGGKGELIDLPGLTRDSLDTYVCEDHQADLVMRTRIKPEQHVIKPGKSLLLGGLVRITPTTPDVIVMAYPFVPLPTHVTSNEKAAGIQVQERASGVPVITKPGLGGIISSAGKYPLKWDVTKQRSGPLTNRSAVGLKAEQLPYKIFSTDVLIEGCGWVELVAQVRKKRFEAHEGSVISSQSSTTNTVSEHDYSYPEVEIFSPEGKHIGCRPPMNAWLLGGRKKAPVSQRKSRPRRSMKGAKKAMKQAAKLACSS
ncbi:hypothetical protein L228DRAFT_250393 [Xylona heveae TC161]|uniref:Genetic interactor of prohibitins 3, mitochondrial n=1 Tax=Xylona heveae (strain CBS 132557 / TC161) TaxID=1328760 RepID=A0A165A5F0_XYLHT|nr:hypothetical protein L228DRAFT_250393 [Xylona heveae TC161]KZF19976.1 hypothetical protein L228DRAFT_250393 [Xylona heveae TC161]